MKKCDKTAMQSNADFFKALGHPTRLWIVEQLSDGAEPVHEHVWGDWISNNDGTHYRTCSGEDCPVCALVAICRNTLRSFSIGLILFALLLASVARSFSLDDTRVDSARAITPVSLKDKLLN